MDFKALADSLLQRSEALLQEWLSSGKRVGNEWVVGSLQNDEGSSCSTNILTGAGADFATGQKWGDLISLYAAKLGITQLQAYRILNDTDSNGHNGNGTQTNGNGHRPTKRRSGGRQIISPVPDDAPGCLCVDPSVGAPARIFTYRTADGRVSGYIARYEPQNELQLRGSFAGRHKLVKPWTYGAHAGNEPRWALGGWPVPRPLYGLDDLAARPQAPVMVVEGEPAVEAARQFSNSYVVVTWQAGTAGVDYADFAPLYGRSILLWPDADTPGVEAMWKLAAKLLTHCPQVKLISPDGQPDGWDAADFAREHPDATWATFKEWALPRLKTLTHADIKEWRSSKAPQAAPVQTVATPAPDTTPLTPASRKVDWYVWKLDCNNAGEPVTNLNNAVSILERDLQLNGLVWFDEFLSRILTVGSDGKPREWGDPDDINLALDLQRRIGITKISIETVQKAVVAVAMRNVKNCVRDWIDSLVWDEVPRIDNFFEDHFGATGNEYTRAASKNFWLSMAARVYKPGCKVDNVIVLEGDEGVGKSTVLQIIAGEWFTEQHESLMNPKAFFEVIQGALITEIGEMEAFNRAELTKVMAVVTCRSDKYRDSYGHYASYHPRQGVFVCTTNNRASNRSPDGGRRWWYVLCGEVDVSSVAANREQYFAEARARLAPDSGWNDRIWRFNHGETWWVMPGDATRMEQAARYEADTWAPAVEEFLSGRAYTITGSAGSCAIWGGSRRSNASTGRLSGCGASSRPHPSRPA